MTVIDKCQTNKQTNKQKQRQKNIQTFRRKKKYKLTDRQTSKLTCWHIDRHMDKKIKNEALCSVIIE